MYALSVYASDKQADAPSMEEVDDETDTDGDTEQTVKWTVTKRKKVKKPSEDKGYLSTGMIVLISVGTAAAAAGGITTAVAVHRKKKNRKAHDNE